MARWRVGALARWRSGVVRRVEPEPENPATRIASGRPFAQTPGAQTVCFGVEGHGGTGSDLANQRRPRYGCARLRGPTTLAVHEKSFYPMGEKAAYWVSVVLGAMVFPLLAANVYLSEGNRARQTEIVQRHDAIKRGADMERLTYGIAKALGEIAIKYDDDGVRALLRAEGVPNWRDVVKSDKPKTGKTARTTPTPSR